MEKSFLEPEMLRKLISYDPETGVLTWRERGREFFKRDQDWRRWNNKYSLKPAGALSASSGYLNVKILDKPYSCHRVAYAIYHGAWPRHQVDHIDGDRANNRIANLRDVTHAENHRNQKVRSDNSSGVMGVYFHKKAGKWCARVKVHGQNIHIGLFEGLEEAIAARKAADIKYGFHQNHGRG